MGHVAFAGATPALSGATVRVELHDVTRIDAPSRVVAEQVIANVSMHSGTRGTVPFCLLLSEKLDEKAVYALRAHVDLDGSGRVTPGDFVTMESYPVSPRDPGNVMTLVVREIEK
jgi:putative lipoprotein